MKYIRLFLALLKDTVIEWNDDGAPMLAAALAYYTAFSIAPLIIFVLAIVGLLADQTTVQKEITHQIAITIGADAASVINDLIDNTSQPTEGIVSSILGIVALIFGALGVFNNLQVSLDRIWNVEDVEQKNGAITFIRDKLLSFGMILAIGFLLLVSLVFSTVLSFFDNYLKTILFGADVVLHIVSILVSFTITTVLFMLIFKILPHRHIAWRDVWVGSAFTALLFTLGRTVLGIYLANSAVASTYGAAGAFVLILLWIYYSAQILLFGAEFTQIFAKRFGSNAIKKDGSDPAHPTIQTN